MTNYREILRLHSLGLNKTEIAASCQCARNTVAATLQRAANCGLQWPLPEEMSDKQLAELLFPTSASKPVQDAGLRLHPQGTPAQWCHLESALAGILRPMQGYWTDPISVHPVQQVLQRLPGENQCHHALKSQVW